MKSGKILLAGLAGAGAILLLNAPLAMANEAAAAATGGITSPIAQSVLFISAAFAMAIGVIAPVTGQSKAVVAACEGMARNPGVAGKLMTTMILGLAMMESLAIYVLVVALILLLANPFI
ncbi:ATP synthase F0 sector subunit c [hydrothermal vent metagenome]|uniref:ATP synthase F0 sector subunit c n=1 Tax=hydrothermal vent metagenome TaxID=652676 RepID=A0A3B0VCF5_9ZZZZ